MTTNIGWYGNIMICRRRIPRNPVVICLILICAGLFFMKTGDIALFNKPYHEIRVIKKTSNVKTSTFSSNTETSDPSLAEIDRLRRESTNLNVKDNDEISYNEMLKKHNDSLKLQAEQNDPFASNTDKTKYTDFLNFQPTFADTQYTAEQLRPVIASLNKRRLTYNADKFPSLMEDHPVIVIQVHKRIIYFKELLDSLQRAKGIENVLLVISHDFYLDSLNALIRQITFCQVCLHFFN